MELLSGTNEKPRTVQVEFDETETTKVIELIKKLKENI
jgi:hypothetical protein